MKKYIASAALAFLLVFAAGVFWFFGDNLAQYAWYEMERPYWALLLIKKDAALAYELGNQYFGGSLGYDLESAERAFKKSLNIRPGKPYASYQLARIYFVQNRQAEALAAANKELEANPGNQRAYYMRGLIHGFSGDFDKASDDFLRFTNWAPGEWAGWNDLAWALSSAGRHQEAKEAVLRSFEVVAGAVSNPWLWNSLGVAQLNLEQYREAGSSFTKALERAQDLTKEDWRLAYPGNDPAGDAASIEAFITAIEDNLRRSVMHN